LPNTIEPKGDLSAAALVALSDRAPNPGVSMKDRSISPLRGAAWPALLVCLLACSGTAQAQWAWRDASGNTTYSDTPPPADIRPDAILRRPGALAPLPDASANPSGDNAATPVTRTAPGAAGTAKAANAPKTWAEQDADFRKRREERQKAEQKQAAEDAKAAEKMAACNQSRGYLDMIQAGTRLMRPNPDGTRGYMDDDARAAEVQKTQESIARNCY
jgi:hypothetical protein